MATLIGSRAIKEHFPEFKRVTETTDWDFQSSRYPCDMFLKLEGEDWFVDERLGAWSWGRIANPDELLTLKISHAFWEIGSPQNWDKHAADIVFLQRNGAVFIRELYDILLPIWKDKYAPKKTNLRQSKGDFFADSVVRKYDHDSLHRSVAYLHQPIYEMILKDGSEVDCSWDKFQSLPHHAKIKLCREEVFVTALERILIPKSYAVSARFAYHWSLRRTITSLFKGEWALFMACHLSELWSPSFDYVQHHKNNSHRLIALEAS